MRGRTRFSVRLLGAVRLGDGRAMPGTLIEVDAGTARQLIDAGLAVLADERELPQLFAALQLHNGSRWATPATR